MFYGSYVIPELIHHTPGAICGKNTYNIILPIFGRLMQLKLHIMAE
jgi:hypothetical protein